MNQNTHYFELCRPKDVSGSIFMNTLGVMSDKHILGMMYNAFVAGDIGTPKNLLLRAAHEYEADELQPVRYHTEWVGDQRRSHRHKLYDLGEKNLVLVKSGSIFAILPDCSLVVRGSVFPRGIHGFKVLMIDVHLDQELVE